MVPADPNNGRRREETMVQSGLHLAAAVGLVLAIATGPATAQPAGGTAVNLSGGKVKVGVLTDIAGPTAMANGKGSVTAAELAAEDFGAGLNVEVVGTALRHALHRLGVGLQSSRRRRRP